MPTVGGEPGDDRAEFAEEQRRLSLELGEDPELQRLSLATTWQSDKHGYSYVWNWLGVPIIQMPADILAMQEIIWRCRPEVIIETGVARGGSVIMYASILELIGDGAVVGVDIDIRAHNREAVEHHPMARRIRLVEGSSVEAGTLDAVRALVGDARRVMVVLDSDHTHDHVLAELHAYADMVTPGQYLVAADTVVEHLPPQVHRPRLWGPGNSPGSAVAAFLAERTDFAVDEVLNAKLVMSQSPGGYLVRGGG